MHAEAHVSLNPFSSNANQYATSDTTLGRDYVDSYTISATDGARQTNVVNSSLQHLRSSVWQCKRICDNSIDCNGFYAVSVPRMGRSDGFLCFYYNDCAPFKLESGSRTTGVLSLVNQTLWLSSDMLNPDCQFPTDPTYSCSYVNAADNHCVASPSGDYALVLSPKLEFTVWHSGGFGCDWASDRDAYRKHAIDSSQQAWPKVTMRQNGTVDACADDEEYYTRGCTTFGSAFGPLSPNPHQSPWGIYINDNGDVSISTGNLTVHHWLALDRTFHAANATHPAGQSTGQGAEEDRSGRAPFLHPSMACPLRVFLFLFSLLLLFLLLVQQNRILRVTKVVRHHKSFLTLDRDIFFLFPFFFCN
jgi:hypothetical protein